MSATDEQRAEVRRLQDDTERARLRYLETAERITASVRAVIANAHGLTLEQFLTWVGADMQRVDEAQAKWFEAGKISRAKYAEVFAAVQA